jgi:hypothetical protein
LFAPYAHAASGHEAARLIDHTAQPPAMVCPMGGSAMGFNDFPARYFSFLSV